MDKFDAIQVWLRQVAMSHSNNVNTGLQYKFGFQQFCKFIGKTPEQILNEYERADERKFKRKYAMYLGAHISALSEEFTPNTIDARVAAIRSFFKYNNLPLGFVSSVKKRVVFHNRDITKDEILLILADSRPRDKAFFSMMAQSGIRPETLCNLQLKHIEPDFSKGIIPCKVDVPEELAKGAYHSYFSFIADESVNYLKAYFNKRPKIIKDSYLFTNHGSEDQASPKSFSRIFARTIQALRKKGALDYELGPYHKPSELRLYNLRKYFKKNSMQMGFEESEFLMGHKQGVRDHYLPKDTEHYRQLYKDKAMPNLRLESSVPLETDKQIQELRDQLKARDTQIQEMKEWYQKYADDLHKEFNKLFQYVEEKQVEGISAAIDRRIESARTPEEAAALTKEFRGAKDYVQKMAEQSHRVVENLPHVVNEILMRIPQEQFEKIPQEKFEKILGEVIKEVMRKEVKEKKKGNQ